MARQIPDIFDKKLELGEVSAQAASANGSAVEIGGGGSSSGVVMVVLNVTEEPDFTTEDEAYALKMQGSDAIGFGSGVVDLVQFEGIQPDGTAVILGKHKAYFETDKRYVRYVSTLAGTTPAWGFHRPAGMPADPSSVAPPPSITSGPMGEPP